MYKELDPNIGVTVCILAYNHEHYIEEALLSVIYQKTNFDVEILVGEDGSNDNTKVVLEALKIEYPDRFTIIYQDQKNKIFVDSRPTGRYNFIDLLHRAKGKYIATLDGDDFWIDPNKLQKQVDLLEANPHCAGCFHNSEMINAQGEAEGFILNQVNTLPLSQKDVVAAPTRFGHTSSLVFRNNKNFFIPTHFQKSICDKILLYLVAEKGSWMGIDAVMSCYRLHPTGVYSQTNKVNQLLFMLNVYESLKQDTDSFHKYKAEIKRKLIYYHHELMKIFSMQDKYRLYITHLLGFIKNEKKNLRLLKILIKEELLKLK
jgi:glycosyltransferase involved in cell wall biosynthesis